MSSEKSTSAQWNHQEYDRRFPADLAYQGLASHLTRSWGTGSAILKGIVEAGTREAQKTNLFAVCVVRGVDGHVVFLALEDLQSILLLRHDWWAMAGYAQVILRVAERQGVWWRTRKCNSRTSSRPFTQLPSREVLSGLSRGNLAVFDLKDFVAGDWRSHGSMSRLRFDLAVSTLTTTDDDRILF